MKRSLIMKAPMLLTILVFLSLSPLAFAEGLKVEDGQKAYVAKVISAENVKGLEVRLAKALRKDGCNSYGLLMTNVRVSGEGDGLHDTYFFDAGIMQTQMFCPGRKPLFETIYSEPVFIKSSSKGNENNKVIVTIIIPKEYELEVKEVK
jgi:hypothetical protein